MATDIPNTKLSDILAEFVDDFEARSDSVSNFAKTNGLTFHQAWVIIQMRKNLPAD